MKKIRIKGEPTEVSLIRDTILDEFKDLTFVEEGHKYFLNGNQLPSVSEVTHKFSNPFDTEAQAAKYAEKHGETQQYWIDKWRYNSLLATTSGTLVHSYGESLGWLRSGHPEFITEENKCKYIADKGWLIPTREKEKAILKFFDEFPKNLHFVLAETKVYSNKSQISKCSQQFCGTFDLLGYYKHPTNDAKSGLVVLDYKTNAELTKSYSREHDKMLLPPFTDMWDEPLSLYTLQLSCYALCLRGIGLNVLGLRIIWLKDDGTYELLPLRDLSKEEYFKKAL